MISRAQLKDHLDYPGEVDNIIRDYQLDELLTFTNFSLCELIRDGLLMKIIKSHNNKIIKHLIDNIICIIDVLDFMKNYLVHYLLCMKNIKLFSYFVDKYHINLESQNRNGTRPIHIACEHSRIGMINYLVIKGVDLEANDNYGYRPIHCAYQRTPEIIEILVKSKVDLESRTNDKSSVLHLSCRYAKYDTIKYFLSKNINLNNKITILDCPHYDISDLLSLNKKITTEQRKELSDIIDGKKLNCRIINRLNK